jgi:hypothetical protein
LASREVTARDLTEAFYRRIAALDDRVHAYVTLTREEALSRPIALISDARQGSPAHCWASSGDQRCDLYRGYPYYLWLQDAPQLRAALRCHGDRAP